MDKVKVFEKELSYIKNDRYKKSTEVLIGLLPDYFFEVPASSTGKYHPSFALGDGGLVRHTKVAVRIAKTLFDNECVSGAYSNNEKDLMMIALILHDGIKYGEIKDRYAKFEHALLAADFVKKNKDKTEFNDKEIEFLYNVISAHMGAFTTSNYSNIVLPRPESRFQRFVHMCDDLSSKKFLKVEFDENNNIID